MDDLAITQKASLEQEKTQFLKRIKVSSAQDALRNALVAAFQRNLTYKTGISQLARKPLQAALRNRLQEIVPLYGKPVSDEMHAKNLVEMANSLSAEFGYLLNDGRLRIGTVQKSLNLYLKILWCLSKVCPVPPHCPIDGQILRKISISDAWTKLDSVTVYNDWIGKLRDHAKFYGFKNVAEWELAAWNTK
jgi:hypothetical protein